jgi:hypothetical protein
MEATLLAEGAGRDQGRYIMSRKHPSVSAMSLTDAGHHPGSETPGRGSENSQIDAADSLPVRSRTAIERLGARSVPQASLSQPHDAEPTCATATLKSP